MIFHFKSIATFRRWNTSNTRLRVIQWEEKWFSSASTWNLFVLTDKYSLSSSHLRPLQVTPCTHTEARRISFKLRYLPWSGDPARRSGACDTCFGLNPRPQEFLMAPRLYPETPRDLEFRVAKDELRYLRSRARPCSILLRRLEVL